MGAINFGAATNGFMRGYDFVDEEIDENKAEKQQQTAIDRQYAREDKQDARADRQDQRQQDIYEQQSRLLTRRELEPEAARAWAAYKASGYTKFDPEFAAKAKAANANDFLPEYYSVPGNLEANIKASQLLEQALASGDITQVNSPEFVEQINTVYADKIKRGIGEVHAESGKQIVDKRIAGFDMAPAADEGGKKRGRVVPIIEVQLDDGSTYQAPSTINASTQGHDPVLMEDAGNLIDDVLGRGQAAKSLASDPGFMQKIRTAESALSLNQAPAPQSPQGKLLADRNALPADSPDRQFYNSALKANSSKGGDTPSNLEKEVEYIQKKIKQETGNNITTEDAIAIAKMPAFDPGRFVGEYVADNLEVQSDVFYEGKLRTEQELIEDGTKAAKIIQEMRANFNKPEAEGGDERITQIMKANPGKSQAWAQAYLKHLDSQQ